MDNQQEAAGFQPVRSVTIQHATITLAPIRRMPPVQAEALICGRFAVTVPDGSPLNTHPITFWHAITHVATGYLAACVEGRDKAIALARAFDAALGAEDITEADFQPEWTPRYRAWVEHAVSHVKEAH